MKEYQFECFDQKYMQKLVGGLFLTFLIIFLSTIFLIKGLTFIMVGSILSMIIPVIIFQFYRKKIKQNGSAKIHADFAEFNIANIETKINYSEIKSYMIQDFNGTFMNLKLIDNTKFNISSNNTYCDTYQFGIFAQDFQKTLQEFKKENQVNIKRRKNFFEYKWVFPFLIIFTGAILYMILEGIYLGKKLPIPSLLMTIGPLITLWAGYLSNRKKSEE